MSASTEHLNEVRLRGRLADQPIFRELPSGDVLAVFRLTVARPAADRGKVDSLECVSVRPRVRTTLQKAIPGTVYEVEGSLRRRFWRSPTGPTSRCAVDVTAIRISRPGRAGAAPSAPKPVSE